MAPFFIGAASCLTLAAGHHFRFPMCEHLSSDIRAGLGIITLRRPQALNALSLDMIRAMTRALLDFRDDPGVDMVVFASGSERAFCAGGDIRFFHRVATGGLQAGSALLEDFFTEEYRLNHLIHHYPKPTVALMDGVVMGGGMGISQGTRMRIVTERTRMGMPEVSIGLFPDVGGGWFLARASGKLGFELALTGRTIQAHDALLAGLADVAINSDAIGEVLPLLLSSPAASRMRALQDFARQHPCPATPGVYAEHANTINALFAARSMPDILRALQSADSAYAAQALAMLRERSPLMLCVSLKQLRRAGSQTVGECLRMERTMMRRVFEGGEGVEGIRARVIDKDNAPRWQHASVEDVPQADIDRHFQPAWPDWAHPLRDLQ